MSGTADRQRAAALGAMDATTLINAKLPKLLSPGIMTPAQLDQVQRVLDAEVLYPDLKKKWEDLNRQSVPPGQRGDPEGQAQRNPDIVRQRDQVWQQMRALAIAETDKQVRINYEKLLTIDAFKPRSDNPDEAAYLIQVAQVLADRGVWLRFSRSKAHIHQTQTPYNDPKAWLVDLWLGFNGRDSIPIERGAGLLNREAILGTQAFGYGYAVSVSQGSTRRLLEDAINRVLSQRHMGWDEHQWWWQHRSEYPIVSKVSDVFGGADWPDPAMWLEPLTHIRKARELNNDGKLIEAGKFVTLAAWQVNWRAQALQAYIDATLKGATRAVDVLEIAATAGQIAETVLTVIWLGQGMIRLLSKRGASEVISTVAKEGSVSPPARAAQYAEEKMYQKYIRGKAPASKSPAPAKSPTGSPVSKSTTPPGQRPASGSSGSPGQAGSGGKPPTPPNPPGSAVTTPPPTPDDWRAVVDVLSDLVIKYEPKGQVAKHIERRVATVGVENFGRAPTLEQLNLVRARARDLMRSHQKSLRGPKLKSPDRQSADRLLDRLDAMEMEGVFPPRVPPPERGVWRDANGRVIFRESDWSS